MELLQALYDGLSPVKKLLVSQWADQYRILTSESAAKPGRWRTSRVPFLRAIMDDLSPMSPVNEVIVMKGVQLGFTESGLNMVGAYIDLDPCPIMYVMPTIEMSKGISESRIDPMIENCESLRKKIRPAKEKDSGNTKLKKQYPGGVLVLAGANSAASLRSRPVKVLCLDEVDGYPLNIDQEGSPISLAEKRTSTFGAQKKIYKLSTPTITGKSVIEAEFEATEKRYYHIPCPHCGGMQHLKWERMRWDAGKPETARYQCEHCDDLIEERYKPQMLEAGEWIATVPENQKANKRGYHLNSLYSPLGWLSWSDVVAEWEKAQKDVNLLQTFVNTILGETWKEKGDAPEWQALRNRRETYTIGVVPNDVCVLTAGVDVQGDRLELEVVGWCEGRRSYSIDYRVLEGDTEKQSTWEKLRAVLNESFVREDGAAMNIRMMAIDTGYRTQTVYQFCRGEDASRVVPVKGKDNQPVIAGTPQAVDVMKNGKKVGGLRLWNIGVGVVKSELYGWLRLEKDEEGRAPDGYCHYPEYGDTYFKGLVSEELQFKIIRGYRQYQWVKIYERNEPLDCRVYARAAANIVGIDRWKPERWAEERANYFVKKQEEAAPAPKKTSRSGFWNR